MSTKLTAKIEANGVSKTFGDTVALDKVDLVVEEGEICALLGPNGAGKTTFVRILSTLIRPDHGWCRIAGHDVVTEADAVRRAIGVTGQFSAVDDLLTGRENLRLMADLAHLAKPKAARVDAMLERFELVDAADRPASTYSGGMRRRLDLAMTLISSPAVIFLDEPTTGLDPRSRHEMWQSVRKLANDGTTVLLTTQYLEEADQLADRVIVVDAGRVVASGTPAELKARVPGGHVDLGFDRPESHRAALGILTTAESAEDTLTLRVPIGAGTVELRKILAELDDAAITVDHLEVHTPDLDDVFFAVTGAPTTERTLL